MVRIHHVLKHAVPASQCPGERILRDYSAHSAHILYSAQPADIRLFFLFPGNEFCIHPFGQA
ncbi:hypothetical protein EL06_24515 [Salmonella enterica subsp. diarizonae]|uniref:Uncharacterized protein n=1 Tax=Salmonella diarizonae TaxID=59204 RepID=A0A6C8Y227_SALDZ|nr:hypothetical protein [Salmonella enterica subsp. diarizonae]